MSESVPSRFRNSSDYVDRIPVHAVWEITLACDLKCRHCGSRAGKRRPQELTTTECLQVVADLERLGTRELTLIGGEAYLRKDWIDIISAAKSAGMYCSIQTGARNLTYERLEAAKKAGLDGVGVSIDGLEDLHDSVRGVSGSFNAAIEAITRVKDLGISISVNTQIGPATITQLNQICETLLEQGVTHWQLQLTVAMGNAVDNDDLLLQPYQLIELIPLIAELHEYAENQGMVVAVGNNIGYFGPYEYLFRGYALATPHWTGCSAGSTVIGIEADGLIKGCPSLESRRYGAGNVRTENLVSAWKSRNIVPFPHDISERPLWGFCRTCYYADNCGAGCSWTADSLFGRAGNNPYCHHRALELEERGLRERIQKYQEANPAAFGIGRFELIVESIDDGTVVERVRGDTMGKDETHVQPETPPLNVQPPTQSQYPVSLALCRSCYRFIKVSEAECPFCGADVETEQRRYEIDTVRRTRILEDVVALLEK